MVLAKIKETNAEGRERARIMLEDDGGGTLCARRICHLEDVLISAVFDYASRHVYPLENPSTSERLAVSAVGGYGRGTLAPGSDIDLLFVLPYRSTPWTEQVAEWILYMLWDLGQKVRAALAARGVASVAAEGFAAPGVVVCYTDDPEVKTGKAFVKEGAQIAAGVPLQVGEPDDFRTFRLGLFGLDKLYDVDATVARLTAVLDEVL